MDDREKTNGYYLEEVVTEQDVRSVRTLLPKIPEMGMYVTDTGQQISKLGAVTEARVHDLDGLKYFCTYSVGEKQFPSWYELKIGESRVYSEEMLKVLKNQIIWSENKTRSSLMFNVAFRRSGSTYVRLDLNYSIELLQGEFNMYTDSDGLVFMEYSNTSVSNFTLPRRLTGEDEALLGVQLAFSATWSASVQWQKIVCSSKKWDGLVSAISAAHALIAAEGYRVIDMGKMYRVSGAKRRRRVNSTEIKWPLCLLPAIYFFASVSFSNEGNWIKGSASQLGNLLGDIDRENLGYRELNKSLVRNDRMYWRVVEDESRATSSDSIIMKIVGWLKNQITR